MSENDLETSEKPASVREALEKAADSIGFSDGPDDEPTSKDSTTIESDEAPEGKNSTEKPEAKPKDISDQTVELKTDEVEAETEEVQPATYEAPQFWSAKHKQAFAKAPKEVQEAILSHEDQRNRFVYQLQQEVQGARTRLESIDKVFEPHLAKLQQFGLSKEAATEKLMGWQHALDTNPREAINRLAVTYGLTPPYQGNGEDEGVGEYHDPRLDEALQSVDELKTFISQQQAAAQEQVFQYHINEFKQETDEQGNLLRPYADAIEPQMAQTIAHIRQVYPEMGIPDLLRHSYDAVMKDFEEKLVKPRLSAAPQAQQPKPTPQVLTKRIKDAASATVSGAPNGSTSPAIPKGIRAKIEYAAQQLGI